MNGLVEAMWMPVVTKCTDGYVIRLNSDKYFCLEAQMFSIALLAQTKTLA